MPSRLRKGRDVKDAHRLIHRHVLLPRAIANVRRPRCADDALALAEAAGARPVLLHHPDPCVMDVLTTFTPAAMSVERLKCKFRKVHDTAPL